MRAPADRRERGCIAGDGIKTDIDNLRLSCHRDTTRGSGRPAPLRRAAANRGGHNRRLRASGRPEAALVAELTRAVVLVGVDGVAGWRSGA